MLRTIFVARNRRIQTISAMPLEPIGLDTAVTEYPDFDDDLMATR